MIDEIREKFAVSLFEFSKHAVDQSILRRISVLEIRDAVSTGEIIEDYPNDKYGCTSSAATRHGRSSKSLRFTNPMKICG